MDARALGVAALLAALGVAGGYWAVTATDDEPARLSAAEPVPGRSPSYPSDPEVEVLPDPRTPALEAGLALVPRRIGNRQFGAWLSVPVGWVRTDSDLVETKWEPHKAPVNSYLLRIKSLTGQRQTVAQALAQRLGALESTVTQFELEVDHEDTLVATYVLGGYRRLTMERFLELDGDGIADVTVVVIGRLGDRDGLLDLLERVSASAEPTAG
ncbi:hypothetical protein [Nocardioides sp. cx-173]|uniref:hypothetical protein n=1 Tax=Nocardioides sp. cx-173 TaxID=2898796 RepID=UPI001E4BEF79|nr:hypothetical protein [Nocardioides sp. cx-173]MCD4523934.1 hypothetical protein [Nocardioides sp. cx-173]UGB41750.1 hypothetical protein LQ940_20660 [Nocardioides sp. cx-173]